jgi:hypothetical protein
MPMGSFELLRLHQQQALVGGDVDGLGRLHHTSHIGGRDFLVFHGHHAAGVDAPDVAARDAGVDAADFAVGHQLGFFQGLLDALHRGIDVDHHATLEAIAGRNAQTGQFHFAAGQHLGDHCHDFVGADVQPHHQILEFFCHMDLVIAFI